MNKNLNNKNINRNIVNEYKSVENIMQDNIAGNVEDCQEGASGGSIEGNRGNGIESTAQGIVESGDGYNIENNRIKALIQKIISIIEGLVSIEAKGVKEVRLVDLKNQVYILEKIMNMIKKYELNDKPLLKMDHEIIQGFIDRYSKMTKPK